MCVSLGGAHRSRCRMILVMTLVAMMGLARMLPNSLVMVRGSTMVTWEGGGEKHSSSKNVESLSILEFDH